MVRNYDEKTLKALRQEERIEAIFGTDVVVRKIPFESRKGLLDPRLKEIMDAKKTVDGVIAMPPFDTAWLSLSIDELLLKLQQLADSGAKKKADEALRLRPDGSADDIIDADIECVWNELKTCERNVGYYQYIAKGHENKKRPCYISIHGGGLCMGHPVRNDACCRYIANCADAVVFDVDYALAPQNRFPAALDDCWNLLNYVYKNADNLGIDRTKIVVGGGSAGGNLTAALSLKDRDEKTNMIALQVLMVPCVLFSDCEIEGYKASVDNFVFADEIISYVGKPEIPESTFGIKSMGKGYCGEESIFMPYISPLTAKDFSKLPRAIVQVSSLDILWQQGVHYGKFMREAGVDVRIIMYEGMDHGSVGSLGIVPQAEDMLIEIADAINNL